MTEKPDERDERDETGATDKERGAAEVPVDEPPPPDDELEDSQAMRALLKRAMPKAEDVPDDYILKGVQKKLRVRSKGKFFGDGWSTTQTRMSYGLVALTMLIILCLMFFAISPGSVLP
ncbi:MAG: hypothetical protein U0174_13185 [Polyangiaceae bacterium]